MDNTEILDILVFGSAIVDFICYVDRLPKAGETLHGKKFANGFGGKGANQCVAAARLGAKTALVAKLGTDSWGKQYMDHLQQENININFVKQCNESTGIAQIAVSSNGENHIIIVAGANNYLSEKDMTDAKSLFENAKVLLCQLETPLEATLAALKSFNRISILNAAPAIRDTPIELLEAATILCVNEVEAALMCETPDIKSLTDAKDAIIKLLQMGAKNVIITLGSRGAIYSCKNEHYKCIHVAAYNVEEVIDTTGAGDAFLGALAYHFAQFPEKKFHEHIGYANYVASFTVQHSGTQSSFPKANEIQLILPETYNYSEI